MFSPEPLGEFCCFTSHFKILRFELDSHAGSKLKYQRYHPEYNDLMSFFLFLTDYQLLHLFETQQ